MNYRHSYHTGNFADVFKHIILTALTSALLRKENAFCFLDTHAGQGSYDLQASETQKTKEFTSGITKILQADNPPPLIQQYLQIVNTLNPDGIEPLRFYPGSSYFVRHFLREQDRIVLTELHEEDYQRLKQFYRRDKQVGVHHQDGYNALKAFLPPKERRGLVLIDPPYEQPDELMQMISVLEQALQRWETGIFALWYPIKEYRSIERFHQAVKQRLNRPMLISELSIFPENLATHLNGSGMLIINPPWQLDREINTVLPWLWQTLSSNKQGRYEAKNL
jgi:23S rRNA (adenine2030-N6)-methyltransferase